MYNYVVVFFVGGQALYNSYTYYTGRPVIQDVACTGNEFSPEQCNVSTAIDSYCTDRSTSVGVRCFFDGKSTKLFQDNESISYLSTDDFYHPAHIRLSPQKLCKKSKEAITIKYKKGRQQGVICTCDAKNQQLVQMTKNKDLWDDYGWN